ncbi:MAG: transcriptional regulator [Rubrivivax sp.]
MRTVAETSVFQRYVAEVWSEAERVAFIDFIAASPDAASLIPGSGGCRKVRWSVAGAGKRGGARVIYFLGPDGAVWLLVVYKKAKFDNLPTSFLAQLKQGVEGAL